ncbi:hypothetical protein IV48_GL000836 [Fructilactobacillus fructivorans]|nr:hypothetical protein FC73_GL001314 [Fructilactobacillus fructivorans]KRN13200.1 hypothetical protein IV37_GL000842 [Fructilactobacillus fructivorans]KRN43030.1 hypothetical protein IV48_GL000836 [Fructilactobacillus fructivorans]
MKMNSYFVLGLHGVHSFSILHRVVDALISNPKIATLVFAALVIAILVYQLFLKK